MPRPDSRFRRRPLLGKVIFLCLIGLLLPSIIGGAFLLRNSDHEMTARLHSDHVRLLNTLAISMQMPLWNLAPDQARTILDADMTDPQIVSIVVHDNLGSLFLREDRPERRIGKLFTLSCKVKNLNAEIGEVSVEVSSGVIDASLKKARNVYLVVTVSELLGSTGLIVLMLSTGLLAPLKRLKQDAIELARGKVEKPFEWDRPDELGDLGVSLETTRKELNALFGENERKSSELEEKNRELEQRVMERTAELSRERDRLDLAHRNISLLSEIGREITSTLDRETIMATVYSQLTMLMDADVFGIGIYKPEQAVIEFPFAKQGNLRHQTYSRDTRNKNQLAVWCVDHQDTVFINDFMNDIGAYIQYYDVERERNIVKLEDGSETIFLPQSAIYVPMLAKDKVVGVIVVQSVRKNAYMPVHMHMLNTMAAYTAIALDNAEAYRQLKDAQKQLLLQEKMAALGQLVAGVAHEINTPIGAVKSSGKNIVDALDQALRGLPRVFGILDHDEQMLFLELIDLGRKPAAITNSREERGISRELSRQLEAFGVADYRHRANILVQLRAIENIDRFLPLLKHPDSALILETAYDVSVVASNAANINVAVDRVAKIVFALKSFSRLDHSGEMIISDLRENIETVLTIYQSRIKQGTEVIREYADLPPIRCIPDELTQVWTNLIHNSLQAMGFKGRLTIRMYREGDYAVITIGDTGCGIPVQLRERIFEPFFTTKPAGEGSGLGLDIVKKIVERHQGMIKVDSEVGQGTTFSIYLPCITEES